MRVAVLGGSPIGRRVARDLAERPGVEQVIAVGVRQDAGGRQQSEKLRIEPESPTRLADLLRECDAAVGCFDGDAASEVGAVREAVAAGARYVTGCTDVDVIEEILLLDGEARTAGATVVPGLSVSPGISNLLAGAAGARMAEVRRVRVAWTVHLSGPDSEPAWKAAARSLMGYVPAFEVGGWQREAAGGAEEDVFLPDPIGWQRVRRARGAEVLTLPKHLPAGEEVIVKGRVGEAIADRVIAVAAQGEPSRRTVDRVVGVAHTLAQRTGASGPARWSAVRVDVWGTDTEGRAQNPALAVLDQLANLASAPLVAGVQLAASGELTATGCLPPEAAIPPVRFFALMGEMGVKVATLLRPVADQAG